MPAVPTSSAGIQLPRKLTGVRDRLSSPRTTWRWEESWRLDVLGRKRNERGAESLRIFKFERSPAVDTGWTQACKMASYISPTALNERWTLIYDRWTDIDELKIDDHEECCWKLFWALENRRGMADSDCPVRFLRSTLSVSNHHLLTFDLHGHVFNAFNV